ncbi:MAG TPA: DUF2127 domain-containing protein [Smithellaceae bacterium]|nr:DUF2127 domain-containing protein [Smithellaceae bacterium]HRS88675.1 DUF2127 domain-containing protein [Smithellaceae bacterium]HRV27093.1 DUF2127 domain-containing protein [Smithellaceae bacterium]
MAKNKPLVIILIALYFAIINGLMGLTVSIFVLFFSGELLTAWVKILFIVTLALCLLSFVASYGLWMLADWGRKLAIAICAISVPLNLIAMKIPGQEITYNDAILVIVSIAVDLLIIWYLLRDDIRELFADK